MNWRNVMDDPAGLGILVKGGEAEKTAECEKVRLT